VVVLAQEEARLLNHDYIGTEHILLGLIQEGDGVAARALQSLGISLDAVRARVEDIIGRGDEQSPSHIPFTPRAKKVLELSLREALQLSHNYIGTEHILLGLIREGEGVAAQVLVELGGDLERVRQEVKRILGTAGPVPGEQAGRSGQPPIAMVAGGPGAYQELAPAELVRVVPLAREVVRHRGYRLVLVALEIWSGWIDLRYALLPEDPPTAPPMPEVDLDWRVTDAAGMEYELAGAASSGGRLLRLHQLTFRPGLAEDAGSLTLTVHSHGEGGASLAVVEVAMAPAADDDQGPDPSVTS
jgi:Clp amino terminal domain, pathogenicity island component